jgi:hypothetical protein
MIDVSWGAVNHASSYGIYQSTSAASGPYTLDASGVLGTTWNSGSLPAGNYWFVVVAVIAANWTSAYSSPTGETTTATHPASCTQP